jgi:hypothetical protein
MALAPPDVPGQVFSAMNVPPEEVDPAAVFAIASSLRTACEEKVRHDPDLNLSEAYNGWDQFTRELMRVAVMFEEWACMHVAFDNLEDTWSYYLENCFGEACLAVMDASALASFGADDCLRVAFRLRLPVWENGELPIPVDVVVDNTCADSAFKAFRIQTVRDLVSEPLVVPYTDSDRPFDENLGKRYFGIYGIEEDGFMEHIADRGSYGLARELVLKLVPGAVCAERVVGLCPRS